MGSKWESYPFQEVVDFQEGPGILAQDFRHVGIPLIRLSGLDRGKSVLAGCNYLDPSTVAKRWNHFRLKTGDILLSTSASLGRIAIVTSEAEGAIPYTGIIRMRPRDKRLLAEFIPYLLEGPDFQRQVEMMGVGSVIRHFGPFHLRSMTVTLPPLPEQRAIAAILGALDDKIELNRRMNGTLEATARALFKAWFVDFEPVRARMEGRPSGLPAEIEALFPEEWEEGEGGVRPRGWGVEQLGDLIELAYGKALKEGDRQPGEVAVFGSNGQIGWHHEKLVEGPGIIVGRKGNPGTVIWSHVDFFPIDTAFYVVPKRASMNLYFLLYALQEQGLPSLSADSAVPGLNRNLAYMNAQLVPSVGVLQQFDHIVRPVFQRIHSNNNESRTLAALRDELLPRLMRGEVRVAVEEKGL